jgi:hypothetical protein
MQAVPVTARLKNHKQQNGQWQTFCSLVRIWSVSIAGTDDFVHEPGATIWLKA